MKRTLKKERRFRLDRFGKSPRLRSARKGRRPFFLNLILGTLLAAIGIFYFLGYNAPNAQRAKEEIARGLGLPLPAPEAGPPIETNPLKSPLPVAKDSTPPPGQPGIPSAPSPAPSAPQPGSSEAAEPVKPIRAEPVAVPE
jgi:hypothetical protein